MTAGRGKPGEVLLVAAWVLTAVAFGLWQHSAYAGWTMLGVIFCYRWNRGMP